MMTTADFQVIAKAVADADLLHSARLEVSLSLADNLALVEPRFKPVSFLRSCGISGEDEYLAEEASTYSPRLLDRVTTQIRKGMSL